MQQSFPANIPALNVGGRIFTDLQNLKILTGGFTGTTTINTSFKAADGTTYVVPVGKIFRVLAVRLQAAVTTPAAANAVYLGRSDNDVGQAASTAFTNFTHMGGNSYCSQIGNCSSISGIQNYELAVNFPVPTGKYPAAQAGSTAIVTAGMTLYGYEE